MYAVIDENLLHPSLAAYVKTNFVQTAKLVGDPPRYEIRINGFSFQCGGLHKTLRKKKVETKVCGELEKAILCATRDAMQSGKPNPIVLLSPACASFDQFKNFEIRGEAFREQAIRIVDLFEQEKNRMSAA